MNTEQATQRMINEAYNHLHKTGKKSIEGGGSCCYTGSGCALRPLFANHVVVEDLSRAILGGNANRLLKLNNEFNYANYLNEWVHDNEIHYGNYLKEWVKNIDNSIAYKIQKCHDLCGAREGDEFLREFDESLRKLCESNNYTFPGDYGIPRS